MTHHRASGLEAGLTEDQLDNLRHFESTSHFDDTEKTILRYAVQLTENVSVSEDIYDEVESRFSEQEIVELTLAIGSANLVNRFNEALDISLEQ